jgi:hypothetical protein
MTDPAPDALDVDDLGGGLEPDSDLVVVRFRGAAAKTLEKLRVNMGAASREKVVVQAVKLLISARGEDRGSAR